MKVGPIRQVIMQPTPFCNLNCRYCYLSTEERSDRTLLAPEFAQEMMRYVFDSGYAHEEILIRWHAGEPLAAGINFYKEAIEKINSIVPNGYNVIHTLQTNATFITDQWCELFKKHHMRVGVSIDGPEHIHNKNRVTRSGKGTFNIVMKGIKKLQEHNIPFEVISVLTDYSLDYADEIHDFFNSMNVLSLGFNIEEKEGDHDHVSYDLKMYLERYNNFIKRIYNLQKKSGLCIREIREKEQFILASNQDVETQMAIPFSILSIDCHGEFFTFCPELLGKKSEKYGLFSFGNIREKTIYNVLQSAQFKRIFTDIENGIRKCKETCKYFFLCGGGAPGNKLFENESFDSTITSYCVSRYQIPTNIVLRDLLKNTSEYASQNNV